MSSSPFSVPDAGYMCNKYQLDFLTSCYLVPLVRNLSVATLLFV